MQDKEVYTGVYEMLSYTDVLRHIAEKHGAEGVAIVTDEQQMPVLWHEMQHLYGDTNHLHASSHSETLQRIKDIATIISTDESAMEQFQEAIVSVHDDESFTQAENYLNELREK